MIKRYIQKVFAFFDPTVEPVESPKKSRKKPDTTKLTQYHFDYIRSEYAKWLEANKGKPRAERETSEEFIQRINGAMGTDKSYRALSNFWNGNIKREELPVGTPSFVF